MAEMTKAELLQKVEELEQQNKELADSLESSKALLSEADARIAELTEQVAALSENGSELDEQIAFKRDQLAELEDAIATKKAGKVAEPEKGFGGYTLRKSIYIEGFGTITNENLNAKALEAIKEARAEKYLIKK